MCVPAIILLLKSFFLAEIKFFRLGRKTLDYSPWFRSDFIPPS